MIAKKFLIPLLLIFFARSYGQEITYELSQNDVNFIYNEAIQKVVVSESNIFDLCCLKDYLKENNTLDIAVDDSLFNIERYLVSTEEKLPKTLRSNIANIDSLFRNVSYQIQNPFKIIHRKFNKEIKTALNIYIKFKFSNIARIEDRLYFNVAYANRGIHDSSDFEYVNKFSYELKICEKKLIYFNRILLDYDVCSETHQTFKVNSSFCE